MMMIVTIADLIIFAGYSQFDVILLFGVCWVEVPDICSLAVFRVNDDAATVVSPLPQVLGPMAPFAESH